MNGSRGPRALSALVLPLAVACVPPEERAIGTARQGIVYGDPSPQGGVEDAVLLLRTIVNDGELLCSASLVAKNLAMTARHCIAHVAPGPFNCTPRGELVDNPDGAGQIGADLPADGIELYDGKIPRSKPLALGRQLISTLSSTLCEDDLAFVVLDREVPIAPLALRLDPTTHVGEEMVLVGYGMTETQSDLINFRTQERRRKAGLPIAEIGPNSITDGVTSLAPRTLLLTGPSACVADSGGPLLSAANAVVGVYSLLDGVSCVDREVRHEFVHVPPFARLVERAFQAAGATPSTEPIAPSGDDGGTDQPDATLTPAETAGGSSGGCAVRGASRPDAPLSGLGVLFALAMTARRRVRRTLAQRRPSSGSSLGGRSGGGGVAAGGFGRPATVAGGAPGF